MATYQIIEGDPQHPINYLGVKKALWIEMTSNNNVKYKQYVEMEPLEYKSENPNTHQAEESNATINIYLQELVDQWQADNF